MYLRLIVMFCLSLLVVGLFGQNKSTDWDIVIQEIFEQYVAESDESVDFESFYNDLMQYANSPLPLNSATVEELNRLAFLSDTQIESILAYIYRYGPLQTVYELQLIPGLDMTDIRRMLPFITLGDHSPASIKYYFADYLRDGNNSIFLRTDKVLEKQQGYNPTVSNHYLGTGFYHSLKYSYTFKNKLSFGFTAEKDAGENIWNKVSRAPESFSAHILIRDIGKLKTLAIGDYRASFGQGLVLNMGYGATKSSLVTQISQRDNGIKKFSSSDEFNFLRGVATSFKLKKLTITGLYSQKYLDADTTGGRIESIYITGLHRTTTEINKSNTLKQYLLGANLNWRSNFAQFGVTGLHSVFSDSILPEISPHSVYKFRGIRQLSLSADYRIRLASFNLFGEIATTNQQSSFATIHGCNFSPLSTATLVLLYRYYSPGYNALMANSFSENTQVANESGFYTGAEIRPFRKWKFSVYADSYQFPWLKYDVNTPGEGSDYLLQADYTLSRTVQMYGRIKYEQKLRNAGLDAIQPAYRFGKTQFRYQLTFSSGNLKSTNRIELNFSDSTHTSYRWGFAAYQEISYEFRKIPLKLDFRYVIFDNPDYENRMYMYEKDILYAFSLPVLYGSGLRYYLNLQYEISKQITIWAKFAQTNYSPHRTSVGSGLDEISGNRKSDVRFLLRYTF